MKIYYIFFHCYGDMPYHTREWVETAINLGHDVSVFSSIDPEFLRKIGWDKKVKVIQIPYCSLPVLKYPILMNRYRKLILAEITKTSPPDLVYGRFSLISVASMLLCLKLSIPYAVEINGILDEELKLSKSSRFYRFVCNKVQAYTYKNAGHIIAVTEVIKNWIVNTFGIPRKYITVIHNGVDPVRFSKKDAVQSREKFNIPAGNFVVGYLGSLMPWQEFDVLIKAAPAIIDKIPESIFMIGGGQEPIKTDLIKMVEAAGLKKYFIFAGQIPWDEASGFISCFDVAVNLIRFTDSNYEVSSLKQFSYMACERPVIGSNIPGLGDFISDSGSGISYKPGDVESFTEAVIRIHDMSDEERMKLGKAGREFVLKNYTWEIQVKKTLSFIMNTPAAI